MTTLPSKQSLRFEGESHQARDMAQSSGSDPERYDRARPTYPAALVERIVAASPGRDVLDVGCGTGITGRLFQAAGCRVLGVDTDDRMADLARRSGVEAEVATFESWDPAGRAFDAVIAGQAWHWVDPVAGAVKAAQVLRPGGRLALFWYVFQPPGDLTEAFGAVYQAALPGTPFGRGTLPGLDAYSAFFTKAEAGIRAADAFTEPERWRFDWDRRYTRAEWLDAVPSFGGHSQFPPAALEAILTGLSTAIEAAGGAFGGTFTAVAVSGALGRNTQIG